MEAEIRRRFNLPVSFDSSASPKEFLLVASFGHSKFRLTSVSVARILQSVIGRVSDGFRVLPLADRVFRFSVSFQEVGFHIYNLRSYTCSSFKLFFHLWHSGGPNFRREYQAWEAEQSAQWIQIAKRRNASMPVHLTGANATPIRQSTETQEQRVFRASERDLNFQQSKHLNAQPSVFSRLKFPNSIPFFSPDGKGILGPPPNNGHRLNGGISKLWASNSQGLRCSNCGRAGHTEGKCWFLPPNSRPANSAPLHRAPSVPGDHRLSVSLSGGPIAQL